MQTSVGGTTLPNGMLIGLGEMVANGFVSSEISIDSSIDAEQLLVNDLKSAFKSASNILIICTLLEDVGDWDPSYHP